MTKKPFFLKAIVLLLFFSFPAAAQETLPSDKTTVETQSDDVPAETAETTDGQFGFGCGLFGDCQCSGLQGVGNVAADKPLVRANLSRQGDGDG